MIATFKNYRPCDPVYGEHKNRMSNAVKMHRSSKKTTITTGSVRSGKTFSHRYQEICDAWNNPYKDFVFLICGHAYPSIKLTLEAPMVETLLTLGLISGRDAHNQTDHLINLKNGNKILFRSLENYDDSIRSLNVYGASVHEYTLCKPEALAVVEGRLLLTNGKLYMEGTPKGTSNWAYQKYFADDVKDNWPNVEFVNFELWDNPLITQEAIDRILEGYDPLFAQQEVYGEWVNLTADRVYHAFVPELNVRPFEEKQGEQLYKFVDYNIGINANLLAQYYNGSFWILNEDFGATTTRDMALRWREQHGDKAPSLFIVDDANSGNQGQQAEGQTNRAILSQNGFNIIAGTTSNPPRMARYANTNVYFCNGVGKPHVFIHPRCKRLIAESTTLCYKKNGSDEPDSMQGKAGHITDALGYGIWYLSGGQPSWEFVTPTPQRRAY